MKALPLLILVAALRFEAWAADVIPPELVGEWVSSGARFSREVLTKGGAVYLSSTGFAAVVRASAPTRMAGTATFDTNTSVLTLNLHDNGNLKVTNRIAYHAKEKKLTAEAAESGDKGLTRRREKIPQWVYDETSPGAKPAVTRLSHTEVVHLASQAAERSGFRLADYREPRAAYKTETKTWSAFFHGVEPRRHFSILVNDETGETRIFPGP